MGPWKNYIPDQLKKEDPKMNIYQRIVLMKETVHVWEYEFWKGPTTACYWLYLVDDVLVQWGKAGDWQKESDRIYEIRFSNKEYLRR